MQLNLASLFALVGFASAAAVSSCNANNCLRQVRASAFTTRPTARDCSTYQTTTVAATTVTFTPVTSVGATTTPAVQSPAPTIPAYASGCGSPDEYRSACSCIGSTSKVVVTGTATSTASACGVFAVQATSGAYVGNYFQLPGSPQSLSTTDLGQASKFELRGRNLFAPGSNNMLVNAGNTLETRRIFFDSDYGTSPDSSFRPLECVIDAANALTCTTPIGQNIFQTRPGDPLREAYIGVELTAGNTAFGIRAVAAC